MRPFTGDDRIDQVYFGWSHGSDGLTLLASSFLNPNDEPAWQHELRGHIRLEMVGGEGLPRHAFSLLDYGDEWALLRRVGNGATPGRNDSHALIGPAAALAPAVALGLGGWDQWLENSPQDRWMPALAASQLRKAANTDALLPLARQCERGVGIALTRLLDDPHAQLSIIGCPDEHRLAMVWALRGAASDSLGYARSWTFSTYQVHHGVHVRGLPEVVFLPARLTSATEVRRTIIDLDAEPPASPNAELAHGLVARFLHGAPMPTVARRENEHLQRAGTPSGAAVSYAGTHASSDSSAAGSTSAGSTPVGLGSVGVGSVGVGSVSSGFTGSRPAGSALPDQRPADWPGTQSNGNNQGPGNPPEWRDGQRAVDELRAARSLSELEARLGELERQAEQPAHRVLLREVLDIKAMDGLARFLETVPTDELYERCLRVLYGRTLEDLAFPEAQAHATRLIEEGESEWLARFLSRLADRYHRTPMNHAALRRWKNGVRPRTALTRATAQVRRVRRRVRSLVAAATLAVTVLPAMFALGYFVGRPEPAQSAQVNPTTTQPAVSSEQSPAQSNKPSPGPVSIGMATVVADPDTEVYAFVRVGASYYPQSQCASTDRVNWRCKKDKEPPAKPDVLPTLVAVEMPRDALLELNNKAQEGVAVARDGSWLQEVKVR